MPWDVSVTVVGPEPRTHVEEPELVIVGERVRLELRHDDADVVWRALEPENWASAPNVTSSVPATITRRRSSPLVLEVVFRQPGDAVLEIAGEPFRGEPVDSDADAEIDESPQPPPRRTSSDPVFEPVRSRLRVRVVPTNSTEAYNARTFQRNLRQALELGLAEVQRQADEARRHAIARLRVPASLKQGWIVFDFAAEQAAAQVDPMAAARYIVRLDAALRATPVLYLGSHPAPGITVSVNGIPHRVNRTWTAHTERSEVVLVPSLSGSGATWRALTQEVREQYARDHSMSFHAEDMLLVRFPDDSRSIPIRAGDLPGELTERAIEWWAEEIAWQIIFSGIPVAPVLRAVGRVGRGVLATGLRIVLGVGRRLARSASVARTTMQVLLEYALAAARRARPVTARVARGVESAVPPRPPAQPVRPPRPGSPLPAVERGAVRPPSGVEPPVPRRAPVSPRVARPRPIEAPRGPTTSTRVPRQAARASEPASLAPSGPARPAVPGLAAEAMPAERTTRVLFEAAEADAVGALTEMGLVEQLLAEEHARRQLTEAAYSLIRAVETGERPQVAEASRRLTRALVSHASHFSGATAAQRAEAVRILFQRLRQSGAPQRAAENAARGWLEALQGVTPRDRARVIVQGVIDESRRVARAPSPAPAVVEESMEAGARSARSEAAAAVTDRLAPAESPRPRVRPRVVRDYDVGVDRLVRRRHRVGRRIERTASLREYAPSIDAALRGSSWPGIEQRARALAAAFRSGGARRRGAVNSLKGLLQEAVLATLPWFRRTRSASLARLRRLNATLAQADRFEEVVHFSDDVRQAGELTDGIFFARSSDGTRVVILDILEAKSRTNWRALYTGQRAQIRRDIRRLLEEVVSIDGRTYRHANGTLVFLSDHGMRQPWTLSVPRALADAPNILARVRNGAARSQVSGAMASDFTVVHGALPDSEAVRLAEIVLDEVATPP